ncbi:HNH/ENDO VII family nuclease [Streptococcus ferus]|uniref:HNH/ENDO VII family nuclease n=1 Tax=Streptococcus ferus TaxID=1345 RepID=UPI00359F37AB
MIENLAKPTSEIKTSANEINKKSDEVSGKKIDSDKRIGAAKNNIDYSHDGLRLSDNIIGKAWGYPKTVLDTMYNSQELKHYHDLNLTPMKFGETADGKDRFALVPKDLEMKQPVDGQGRTNQERAEQGLSLIKDGKILEAHHIGQVDGGHYALLTKEEHTQNGYDKMLHDSNKAGVDHGAPFEADKRVMLKAIAEGV